MVCTDLYASSWSKLSAQSECEGSSIRTEDSICLRVLVLRIRADQRTEVVVLDSILVPVSRRKYTGSTFGELEADLRFDELPPPLLAFLALHQVLVELRDSLVWLYEHLGEVTLEVLKYLVILPAES